MYIDKNVCLLEVFWQHTHMKEKRKLKILITEIEKGSERANEQTNERHFKQTNIMKNICCVRAALFLGKRLELGLLVFLSGWIKFIEISICHNKKKELT